MDCSRDRVHDPFDENIQNGPFGVTSICTSNVNLNEDVDLGNSLTVTGQQFSAAASEKDPLIKNFENQIPVRLIRSYNLFNEYAPKTGYRYDGLYIVTNFWIGVNTDLIKYYKFALLRISDQEPPSWSTPLSTSNHTSTLHSSTPLQNYLKNSAPNVYEFKKYSHGSEFVIQKEKHENSSGFSHTQNVENKKVDETKKSSTESAIVTRHVFKKLNTSAECISSIPNMPVMLENRSLTSIGNKEFKTHNTNISIRTGLYNSSHSTQNSSKKNTSSPFCRATKSFNIVKTNQHTENRNLSNKDKNKNLDGKIQTNISNEFPKHINCVSFNAVKSESMKIKFPKDTNAEINIDATDTSLNSCTYKETNNDSKDVCNSSVNLSGTTNNMLNMTNCMYKNEVSTHKVASKELQEIKSLDSLDSMTPDKILHLINNKNDPLSKLLMGNMIGLTSEQSIALQAEEKSKIEDKIVTQTDETQETKERTKFEVISDDINGSRCYKFRRRRKLSRKTMNKPEMLKYNKIHTEKFKNGSVQSLDILEYPRKSRRETSICENLKNKSTKQNHVQKKEPNHLSDSARYIKKNAASKMKARMHLQAVRTIDSSIKKHINKKQRREIANLLIDAKIGPKIRGPRYRRLRCINNECTKQLYERFNTAMCTLNKCKVNTKQSTFQNRNKLTKITRCKRVKNNQTRNIKRSETLNFNCSKISGNFTTSKKVDKNYVAKEIVNNNNNNNNVKDDVNNDNDDNKKEDNNKRTKFIEGNVKIVENEDTVVIKNRKRKLKTVCNDPKCNKINEKLQKNSEKQTSKPCKTDAITQCSLIKGPIAKNPKSNDFVQNNVRNEQYTFIKIEYGSDFKDMKSEIYETTKLGDRNKVNRNSMFRSSTGKYVSCANAVSKLQHSTDLNVSLNSSILFAKKQNKFSPERASAFVPVNVPDNDLKIARLRSIGFKPINFSNNDEDINSQDKRNKALKQNVTEKYNKYTNEENNIVVYMDDELQYQDIEDEDKKSISDKTSDSEVYIERTSDMILEKESCTSLLEQDLESPWHGWKKIVTNKDTYWVGW